MIVLIYNQILIDFNFDYGAEKLGFGFFNLNPYFFHLEWMNSIKNQATHTNYLQSLDSAL